MPKRRDIGYSGYTPEKQRIFSGVLNAQLICVRAIYQKQGHQTPYYYFDLTAGDGYGCELFEGSPLLFLQHALYHKITARMVLFENDEKSAQLLNNRIYSRFGDKASYEVVVADHHSLINTWNRFFADADPPPYGLVYIDPSGNIPPFSILERLSELPIFHRIDFLINCPSATLKRHRRCMISPYEEKLSEALARIHKTHWLIRTPYGPHQWSFLIGTHWQAFPVWQKEGFHTTESTTGRQLLDKLSLTKEELHLKYGTAAASILEMRSKPLQLDLF
jgi:hypothetical protein